MADLHFELGAERFRARDYRGALEHFLLSNRLVPNRNVVFDIAETYAQLKQYPDAYRYYTQALEGETDPRELARIQKALARVAASVAVLRIRTDPPGAAVYIDREDLGARGISPLVLLWLGTRQVLDGQMSAGTMRSAESVASSTSSAYFVKMPVSLAIQAGVTSAVVVFSPNRSAVSRLSTTCR